MNDWNDILNNLNEIWEDFTKQPKENCNLFVDALNSFAKTIEFRKFEYVLSSIPCDVQETIFFQKCDQLSKNDLMYEEVEWLFDELNIVNMEEAVSIINKYVDKDDKLHNYIVNTMENARINNREKLVIILSHFERLIYSTLKREKIPREGIKEMSKSELVKTNHGMSAENLHKTVLWAIINVVFANTDSSKNIDKRLPFRNNILHRGIVDYSDIEVDIAYKTLLIFVAHVIHMNDFLLRRN